MAKTFGTSPAQFLQLTDSQLYILLGLSVFSVLFFVLIILAIVGRKSKKTKAHSAMLVTCLVLFVFFIASGILVAPAIRTALGIAFLDELAKVCQNRLLSIAYTVATALLLIATAILLFSPKKSGKQQQPKKAFRQYFERLCDEGQVVDEVFEPRNVFSELGNTPSDITAYMDRFVSKLAVADDSLVRKNLIIKASGAIGGIEFE